MDYYSQSFYLLLMCTAIKQQLLSIMLVGSLWLEVVSYWHKRVKCGICQDASHQIMEI